jgi:ATP-dependent RNA circularization protein (DNA/RNA ligase family)
MLYEIMEWARRAVNGAASPSKEESTETRRRLEEVAEEILEYVRMGLQALSARDAVIDERNVAFRLRESRATVVAALVLLQHKGQAEPIEATRKWRVRLSRPFHN